MASRANWKGYLNISLVTCSVALLQATSTRKRVSPKRATGRRALKCASCGTG